MDLPIVVDLLTIRDKHQALIDENVRQQNLRWREFDYAARQEVVIKTVDPHKMQARAHGPYTIAQ
eukprot:11239080-Ditylum_brightwellii.AAC.1